MLEKLHDLEPTLLDVAYIAAVKSIKVNVIFVVLIRRFANVKH